MGASDYMVGNAPGGASYMAPNMSLQLMKGLGDLPEDYFQGTQRRRIRELQKPILDANGEPATDYTTIQRELLRRGGGEYAEKLMPYLMGQKLGDQISEQTRALDAYANGPSGRMPAPLGQAAGPGNIQPPQQPQGNLPPQPRLTSAGADNQGQDNVASIASETGLDMGRHLPGIAQRLGVSMDQPLSPEQAQAARTLIGQTAQAIRAGRPPQVAPLTAEQNGVTAAPGVATGASGGAPGPGTARETPAPAAGIVPGGGARSPQEILQADPQLRRLETAAAQANRMAIQYGMLPGGMGKQAAQTAEKNAAMYEARAKERREFLLKNAELTPTQKDVASGAEVDKNLAAARVKQGIAIETGIHASASQYERDLKPYLELSRSLLNDPTMYTGTGADMVLNWNRVKAVYGDAKAAMLQEALQKVTASSTLGQINNQRDQLMEAGGNSSRIFAQQVELVQKAAPALSNTLAGNRFLVEVATRMGETASHIDRMARDYLKTHKYLDSNFNQQVSDYLDKTPLFNKQEMSNPELIGAATIPPALKTQDQVAAWAKKMGLSKGEPLRRPGGGYTAVP